MASFTPWVGVDIREAWNYCETTLAGEFTALNNVSIVIDGCIYDYDYDPMA